jgi:hypothetical protein
MGASMAPEWGGVSASSRRSPSFGWSTQQRHLLGGYRLGTQPVILVLCCLRTSRIGMQA